MRLFGRMWLWSQCDANHRQQQRRQQQRTNADQSHAGAPIHLSRVGDTTTVDARRIHHVQRINDVRKSTGSVIHQSWCWWWKIVFSMLQLLSLAVVVEGYMTDHGARIWTNHYHSKVSFTTTATPIQCLIHFIPSLKVPTSSHCQTTARWMVFVNDGDESMEEDDELPSPESTAAAADDRTDDDAVLGDICDSGGEVLHDLSWRVEKLRLEEQNIQRFLKARPRFLPYQECRKWVQAINRWKTQDDWNEWIAMGEKRNAYIPVSDLFVGTIYDYLLPRLICFLLSIYIYITCHVLIRVDRMIIMDASANG